MCWIEISSAHPFHLLLATFCLNDVVIKSRSIHSTFFSSRSFHLMNYQNSTDGNVRRRKNLDLQSTMVYVRVWIFLLFALYRWSYHFNVWRLWRPRHFFSLSHNHYSQQKKQTRNQSRGFDCDKNKETANIDVRTKWVSHRRLHRIRISRENRVV